MTSRSAETLQVVQRRMLNRIPWLRRLLPPSPTLNTGRLLRDVLEQLPPTSHAVLDLGCGERRLQGAVRCDIVIAPPGIRADAARLPFKSRTFDLVLVTAVLEHVPHPSRVVREIHRILRPGGLLYVEVPFLEGFHADPDDFQRFTFRGLDILLRRFEITRREVCAGPNSALNWILREYPGAWFRSRNLALLAKFVAGWITAPNKVP